MKTFQGIDGSPEHIYLRTLDLHRIDPGQAHLANHLVNRSAAHAVWHGSFLDRDVGILASQR